MDDATRNLIINSFLVLHLLGVASLLAGFLVGMREIRTGIKVNAGVLHGAYLMLLSGLVMSGVADPAKLNVLVIALKSIVLTLIFVVAYKYRKAEKTPIWVVPGIAGMTLLNIVLAIFGGVLSE